MWHLLTFLWWLIQYRLRLLLRRCITCSDWLPVQWSPEAISSFSVGTDPGNQIQKNQANSAAGRANERLLPQCKSAIVLLPKMMMVNLLLRPLHPSYHHAAVICNLQAKRTQRIRHMCNICPSYGRLKLHQRWCQTQSAVLFLTRNQANECPVTFATRQQPSRVWKCPELPREYLQCSATTEVSRWTHFSVENEFSGQPSVRAQMRDLQQSHCQVLTLYNKERPVCFDPTLSRTAQLTRAFIPAWFIHGATSS